MSVITPPQLHQWITENMGYCPKKSSGSSRNLLNNYDLELLIKGDGGLWDHVVKHVHSESKVQHVRRNILLNRLNKFQELQKNDMVGNKIVSLGEVKKYQAKLRKAREEVQEIEKRMQKRGNEIKIASCRLQYLRNVADNAERRYMLLQMGSETIKAKTDAFNSTIKHISLEKGVKTSLHGSNFQHHSLISSDDELPNEIPWLRHMPFVLPVPNECKRFLERCTSMAKDLLDEKLEILNRVKPPSNTSVMSELSLLSIDSRFMEFETPKLFSAVSDTKKNELKSFIHEHVKGFAPQHLFESMLGLFSDEPTKSLTYHDDVSAAFHPEMHINQEERLNEFGKLLSKKVTNCHLIISYDFVAATQDKVAISKMKEHLRNCMSMVENNLKKTFLDKSMQENVYELVEIKTREEFLIGAISYLKKSLKEMHMEISGSSATDQLKKVEDQLKSVEDDMVHHRKLLGNLQKTRKEIKLNVINNHNEVRKCLAGIRSQHFMKRLEDVEHLADLQRRELATFNEYPLECHKKSTLSSGREVMDSRLLINSSIVGGIFLERDATMDGFSQWVKLTLGMAPHSSIEHIFAALLKKMGEVIQLKELAKTNFYFCDGFLQSNLGIIPGLLKHLEADERQWEANVAAAQNEMMSCKSLTEKETDEADSIYQAWFEGKMNNCVPESDLHDGKTFLQWYYDLEPILHKKANLS